MRIAMIGSGYVGLVSGICFSEFGYHITCVDKDANRIERLQQGDIPIYEPGLRTLLQNNVKAERLTFTTDLQQAVAEADVVFIAVGTPARMGDGYADLSYVHQAAEEIAKSLNGYTLIVNKSTVPVGTVRELATRIRAANPSAEFDIAANPEFLREGSAIEDFMRPARIVVGVEHERARQLLAELYRPLTLNETPLLFTSLETAELIKYAANCFLATKIAFINEMADLCEKTGADIEEVSRGMGLDPRIGNKFLQAGPGYGGSCFPKDTLALARMADDIGSPLAIVNAVVASNDSRKVRMAEKVIEACNKSVKNKTIAVLGLTFKPNTDDMRDSASLVIIPALLKAGASIRAYDPQGMKDAAKMLPSDVHYADNVYDCITGADALVIITEWNEFRSLDFTQIKTLMKTSLMIDLRNIYMPEELKRAGIEYRSIGRRG